MTASTTPDAGTPFSTLPLSPAMQANLRQLGYHAMTPIQAASLPLALAGQDLIAQARTGSGKTAAFALPLLTRLNPFHLSVQALVLCPTRELADQVAQELRRLARAVGNIKVLTLCGGATMRPQMASLAHGAHVVVGTPGRLLDHLSRGSLVLRSLGTLVLDEADRMLDMGFHDDIVRVVQQCPDRRQTLLFSATFPEGIDQLARQFQHAPQRVTVSARHAEQTIRQRFYAVEDAARLDAVGALLNHYRPTSTLAFCNTRQQCRDLLAVLQGQGFHALALHGELEQRERDQVLVRFANRSVSVLVATDVAARGLDIAQLEMVINVDLTPDPEVHVHRIGRTGRADQAGWALSLVSERDRRRLAGIEAAQGGAVELLPLDALSATGDGPLTPPMVTLQLQGGRKDKLRPGDVLGALTGDGTLAGTQVGKIHVTDFTTYVAVAREVADVALRQLEVSPVKGRRMKVRLLDE